MQRDMQFIRLGFATHSFSEHLLKKITIVLAGMLISLNALVGQAQSGRRLPKTSAPPPEAKPEAKPAEKRETDEKAKVSIILGIDGRQISYNIPLYFYDSVLQSCADKLRDAPSVKLDVTGRNMSRGEAIKLAKSQKVAYVVLLELRPDGMGVGPMSPDSYTEVLIEYVVFAPENAKVITSGRTYPRAFRKGGVIMGPRTGGRTSPIYAEQLLKQAARDAAERILSALHLIIPGRTIPPIASDRRPSFPHISG